MENAAVKTWNQALEILRGKLNPEIFKLWFAAIQASNPGNGVIRLHVPDDFSIVWLKDNYLDLIQNTLMHVSGQTWDVQFQAGSMPVPTIQANPVAKKEKARPRTKDTSPGGHNGTPDAAFNPRYTFENFVVGSNNNFAHAAALAVAQGPGKSYNPLFLYGGVGLGKTHLLHAIGQHVLQTVKGSHVAFLSSEKFTNEYIDAIQNSQLMRFRKKYRMMDLLLIDDIQFLAGKERIQEEFFHTFNALHENHKQIVLTCDRPASEIQNLEHRLVSRFEWGLVTDMQPPDVETRMAILRKKANSMGVDLPPEILQFIADRIRSNVRRLEGALIRVSTYTSLNGKKPTLELAEGLLRELLHEEGRTAITIELIQKRVADYFDIRLADMASKRRPENIAFPRQIAMYLARQLTGSSLNEIGEAFGGRDHGTVIHACRLVKDRMEVDPNVRQTVGFLEKQLVR